MKKESSTAMVLGIILGILCAFVLIQVTKDKQKPARKINETPAVSLPPTTSKQSEIAITSPEDNMVSNSSSLAIKGKAPQSSILLIITPQSEYSLKIEKKDFSQDINLQEGENNITLYFINNGNIRTKTLTIYYIPE